MAILSGPSLLRYYPKQIIKTITSSDGLTGAAVSKYSNQRATNVATNTGITKMGPVTGISDPEFIAWLNGEL